MKAVMCSMLCRPSAEGLSTLFSRQLLVHEIYEKYFLGAGVGNWLFTSGERCVLGRGGILHALGEIHLLRQTGRQTDRQTDR